MNITNHAKERYVERIKDIKTKNEIKQYIAQNDDMINEHIMKLYEYSDNVFTGQIGGDKTTKSFYLNGDTCLVVDGDCIRTIYRINFAFPEKTRLMVIEGLKHEIIKLQEDMIDESKSVEVKRQEYNSKIEQSKREIEKLKEKVEITEDEIKIYENEKALLNKKLKHNNRHLQEYAEQLFGNTEYKKDIK